MATIHAWSTKWLVNFNLQKTETMTITRKINKPFHPKKNTGTRIDPWGTPALIGRHLECALSITTRCLEIRSDIAILL
jgi:hypothetical protein